MRTFPATILLALALAGCGPRSEQHTRAVERAEVRSGRRYLLRSELRPGRAALGDEVEWRLAVDVPRGRVMVGGPFEGARDSSLELGGLFPLHSTPRPGRDLVRWTRRIQGFDLGPLPLPAMAVRVGSAAGTDTLVFPADTLFIDSLTAAPRDSIDPDRGPVPTELRAVDRAVAAVGVALLAFLASTAVWIGLRLRERPAPARREAPPEPHALRFGRALDALRGQVDQLSRDAFYERLSDAVRGYLEAETGVPAPDRTTREIEEELGRRVPANAGAPEAVGRVLHRADLAKFARARDERAAALAALEEARALAGRLASNTAQPDAGGTSRGAAAGGVPAEAGPEGGR